MKSNKNKKKATTNSKRRGVSAAGKASVSGGPESQSSASRTRRLTGNAASGRKNRRARKKQPTLTNAQVKTWGFSCSDMTEAAVNYKGNLVDRLKRSKALMESWRRGRFLRDISQLAAVGMTKAEVAVRLEIPLEAFEEMLTDPEAGDIWTRAQIGTLVQLKTGILESAMAGRGSALKSLERILQDDRPSSAIDIFRMTEKQMLAITEVTRQTLYTWVSLKGLSRNSDLTFDLRVFVKWFEGHSQRKVNITPKAAGEDSLRELKAERMRNEIDAERGLWLERDSVVMGLVGRLQQFLGLWDRLIDSVADKCSNMPKQGVLEILGKFKDELRGEICKVEIEMKLSEALQAELERFLEKIE